MTIDERKARLKQNLETGALETNLKALDFTDKQVEDIIRVCKRALEGVYGDEIFSPETNIYIRMQELEKLNNE